MAICIRAWIDLSTCRASGGAIPWTAARDWALDEGLDREARRVLWTVLYRLERDRIERERSAADLARGAQ